ncbi:MAG: hypothetical protein U0521_18465 [Anaerolineae bacterium]
MKYKIARDLNEHRQTLVALLESILSQPTLSKADLDRLVRRHARAAGTPIFSRDELIQAYRAFAGSGELPPFDAAVLERLRMKPVRTSSGVTPVTVLTKPFPCPGECIFCPNDVRMPKSYLSDEPGAQRAEQNSFDPYLQTMSRLRAYYNTGHPTDKIEVIVLGGTWSFYPETYQIWFVKRVFDALHDFGAGINHSAEVTALLRNASQLHPSATRSTCGSSAKLSLPRQPRPIIRSCRRSTGTRCAAHGNWRRHWQTPPSARPSSNMLRGRSWKPHIASTKPRPAAASGW